jgi:hypothetical protein
MDAYIDTDRENVACFRLCHVSISAFPEIESPLYMLAEI